MDARFVLLLACFFLSGFAALLYQTAWTRELSFVFGTSELAVAAVLAAYMGGLALGSAAAARFATRLRRPILAYGLLELAIAGSALAVPWAIRAINAIYVSWLGGGDEIYAGNPTLTALFQLGTAFVVLLPPTAFMGATLPLLARHAVRRDSQIGSRVGVLYAINTAGAIAGTVCAAFWLMPEYGLRGSVWFGVALNGLVFVLAALLARSVEKAPALAGAGPHSSADGGARWILPAIAVSGLVSFTYEVVWTRLLGNLVGASLDAFATMLASFLLGIALGSAVAARLATDRTRAAVGFGVAQLGIALASYTAFSAADYLPALAGRLGAAAGAPLASAALALATLLPITICIGATFPFAVRLLATSPEQASRATARAYAWNTLGSIVGALAAGFVLLPELGFAGTMAVAISANLALAVVASLAVTPHRRWLAGAAVAAAAILLVVPVRSPWTLLSSSPLVRHPDDGAIVYSAVGRSATVMLFDHGTGFRLTTNGLPESTILRAGMLPQGLVAHWLGLLPSLVRPEAREMLVVGLGGGVALEPLSSTLEAIDVIELEPEVLRANQRVAKERAIDPLANPAVRMHMGDARGSLQLTGKHYDAVVSQPSHPWTAGASHLYTREFFELVRSRLKSDGVFVQWIGLAFVDEPLLRSLAATLLDVFDHVETYQPGGGGGVLFAASAEPLNSIAGAREALRSNPEAFARFGIHHVEDLAVARVLDRTGTRAFAGDAPLITDDYNMLASRASRLGDAALGPESVQRLWRKHDSVSFEGEGLDSSRLLLGMVAARSRERALTLAQARDGAQEEIGLGWVDYGLGRIGRSARHFARALELAPGDDDAVTGVVVSHLAEFAAARSVAGIAVSDLPELLASVVAATQYAGQQQWDDLAALDAELARIEPGDALFEVTSRLRVQWRLAAGDAASAKEAQSIVETRLLRNWNAWDALLRARAALAANQPVAAWGSLSRIADFLGKNSESPALVASALEVLDGLPAEVAEGLRARLKSGGRNPTLN